MPYALFHIVLFNFLHAQSYHGLIARLGLVDELVHPHILEVSLEGREAELNRVKVGAVWHVEHVLYPQLLHLRFRALRVMDS